VRGYDPGALDRQQSIAVERQDETSHGPGRHHLELTRDERLQRECRNFSRGSPLEEGRIGVGSMQQSRRDDRLDQWNRGDVASGRFGHDGRISKTRFGAGRRAHPNESQRDGHIPQSLIETAGAFGGTDPGRGRFLCEQSGDRVTKKSLTFRETKVHV
jgi:hypothetical protein